MNDAERLELPHIISAEESPLFDKIDGHHYDRSGNPISFRDWARLREYSRKQDGNEYIRVGSTEIGNYWVSTVWLGIDHSFGNGPPLIFETMCFNRNTDESDLAMRRYSTEAEALSGHERMVEEVGLIVEATRREE